MGVRGLQYYLENCCPPACQRVCIPDLAQEYRNRNRSPNQELVIVVDGSSCIRHLYGNLEWIGGGQLIQFGDIAKSFVEQFKSIGIRLVFFFDGPTMEEKRRTWIERRLNKLDSMYYVLDAIENGVQSHKIDKKKHFLLPPGMGQLSRVIFENICGCEVFQSLAECDEEIAHYAKKHKVFAILGQDTDFVIYDKGAALYLSMEKLVLENMTTLLYDHLELARYLKIDVTQLPLLATLMGNDIVDFKEIKAFHIHMMRSRFPNGRIDFKILIPNLALYIRTLPLRRRDLYDRTYELSNRLFRTPERAEEVWSSICSYDALSPQDCNRQVKRYGGRWGQLLAEARKRHKKNQFPSMVYAIMSGLPFESSTSIEDFRKEDLPSFAKATEMIRRRIYGILLHEKPLESGQTHHYVPEWCMAGPNSLDEVNLVRAIPAPSCHPGLFKLWFKNQSSMNNVRWQLFVKSVCLDLDVQKLRNLRPRFLIPTLVLAFLREWNCLEDWEIEAVLATAVCLEQYNTERLAALPADPLTTRGIRIANLVMRSTFVLYLLLAACGYPATVNETAPWLFFDGKLFQIKYNQAMNGCTQQDLCNNRDENELDFLMARDVIYRV